MQAWLRQPHHDPWKLDEACREITVPNLDIVGWYDHCNGDMLMYRSMVKRGKSEVARQGQRLIDRSLGACQPRSASVRPHRLRPRSRHEFE